MQRLNRLSLLPNSQHITKHRRLWWRSKALINILWTGCGLRKMVRLVIIFIASLLISSALPVPAQSADDVGAGEEIGAEMLLFEDIPSVFGASKYEQKVTKAPSSVSIVTAAEIKKYGYRSLQDIVRSQRGFYFTNDRYYTYIGARGLGRPGDYNSRLLLLVDGHRMNENVFLGSNYSDEFMVDVDLIDRVEFIRGPGSSLYGTNALYGVINIITKQGRDYQIMELNGEIGSYDRTRGRITYGDRYQNGLEVLGSATGNYYDGRDLYYPEFDATAHDRDWDKNASTFWKASLSGFSLTGGYSEKRWGYPTPVFEVIFDDPKNRAKETWGYLNLQYQHTFVNDLGFLGRVYRDIYRYDGSYDYDFPPVTLAKDYGYGGRWGAEAQISKEIFSRHHVIFGSEYILNDEIDQAAYYVDPYELNFHDDRKTKTWALYIQDDYAILDNLTLSMGLRMDAFENFGEIFNPRLAAIYSPTLKSTLKLLYGKAFRAPSPFELYYHDNTTQKINPDLQEENIRTYELAWEYLFTNHWRGVLTGYYNELFNLIETQTDPLDDMFQFINRGKIESRGIEAEINGKWRDGWEGALSYAYQRSLDSDTGEVLSNSPEHMVKLNLIVPLYINTFLGLEEQFMSARETDHLDADGRRIETDAFAITNVTLSNKGLFLKGLEISASIYNLFDTAYADPLSPSDNPLQPSLQQDGRIMRLKLTYSY